MALSVLNFFFTLLRYQVVLQLKLQLQLKEMIGNALSA